MAKGDVVPRTGKWVDPMMRIAIALEKIVDILVKKPAQVLKPKS